MIKPIALAWAVSIAVAPRVFADPARPGPSPIFRPVDVFGLRWASDPQIRPDGSVIAFVREANSIMTDRADPRSGWSTRPAAP